MIDVMWFAEVRAELTSAMQEAERARDGEWYFAAMAARRSIDKPMPFLAEIDSDVELTPDDPFTSAG